MKRHLARALITASEWASGSGSGLSLYSLYSTRMLHSEEHRQQCLEDICRDIRWCYKNGRKEDIPTLIELSGWIKHGEIGCEWLEDKEYLKLAEEAYQAGKLYNTAREVAEKLVELIDMFEFPADHPEFAEVKRWLQLTEERTG